jgi:predicted ArsR family transcriptional regulator
MRPSTQLRGARLDTLVAELSARPLDIRGVAELLKCSESAARNYLRELVDGGLVGTSSGRADGIGRALYRLNSDEWARSALKAASAMAAAPVAVTAVRDPLVAALFGAAV